MKLKYKGFLIQLAPKSIGSNCCKLEFIKLDKSNQQTYYGMSVDECISKIEKMLENGVNDGKF